MNLISEN